VIGRVLTLACGSATIKPDYKDRSAGVAECFGPYASLHEWAKRGKVRDSANSAWIANIICLMAGAETDVELLGSPRSGLGDGHDRRDIGILMERLVDPADDAEWGRVEARLRAMTRVLVRRHRARIDRVAKALVAKTTLSAKQIDKLAGRSVNDVRVNAPVLLEMHAMDAPQAQRDGRTAAFKAHFEARGAKIGP
jgi:hypothetical protein